MKINDIIIRINTLQNYIYRGDICKIFNISSNFNKDINVIIFNKKKYNRVYKDTINSFFDKVFFNIIYEY